jgi:hypothetical protein
MCMPASAIASPQSSPLLTKYRSAVADVTGQEERERAARDFVASLSDGDRVLLARALAKSPKQDEMTRGAALLVDLHREKEAAPVFAAFVADGGDMTGYFWSWMHGGDDKRAPRMYIAISRELLARIDSLSGEPRRRAEALLLADGYGPHIDTYSRKAVEDRLAALEHTIR